MGLFRNMGAARNMDWMHKIEVRRLIIFILCLSISSESKLWSLMNDLGTIYSDTPSCLRDLG